ncbi:hypothetical protein [uncultured Psychrosphaera sp.]|jgi:hypothetical protein|uniref:hypothetical protein n=1 Tax=uncultured Psychrosphaera sp. TaxID=1403522 RepID=UPI002625B976|nr:hypothetical protein [uncultured Psychrosphaera sp.]
MSNVKTKDLQEYVEGHGGELVQLTNGNFNIRKGELSVNIGKPKNNRWDDAQFRRAWGDATGIPAPQPGEL